MVDHGCWPEFWPKDRPLHTYIADQLLPELNVGYGNEMSRYFSWVVPSDLTRDNDPDYVFLMGEDSSLFLIHNKGPGPESLLDPEYFELELQGAEIQLWKDPETGEDVPCPIDHDTSEGFAIQKLLTWYEGQAQLYRVLNRGADPADRRKIVSTALWHLNRSFRLIELSGSSILEQRKIENFPSLQAAKNSKYFSPSDFFSHRGIKAGSWILLTLDNSALAMILMGLVEHRGFAKGHTPEVGKTSNWLSVEENIQVIDTETGEYEFQFKLSLVGSSSPLQIVSVVQSVLEFAFYSGVDLIKNPDQSASLSLFFQKHMEGLMAEKYNYRAENFFKAAGAERIFPATLNSGAANWPLDWGSCGSVVLKIDVLSIDPSFGSVTDQSVQKLNLKESRPNWEASDFSRIDPSKYLQRLGQQWQNNLGS